MTDEEIAEQYEKDNCIMWKYDSLSVDEEMAEEYVKNNFERWECDCLPVDDIVKQAFLAGLKAGRPQWHDLRKDPNDLPKDKHNVWCKCLDECGEGWYDKETDTWTLIYRGYHVHCIEAWCEIPTFDKE